MNVSAGEAAIDIHANDITLDCNGSTIINNAHTGTGLLNDNSTNTNVTVTNCTIVDYNMGIEVHTGGGLIITESNVSSCLYGLWADSTTGADTINISSTTFESSATTGIQIDAASYINLTSNTITDAPVNLYRINNSLLNLNTINNSGNLYDGLFLHGCNDNTIDALVAEYNQYGIRLYGNSTGNTITNCKLTDNYKWGLYVQDLDSCSNSIDITNVAGDSGGNPIYFYNDTTGLNVNTITSGELLLCNVNDSTFQSFDMDDSDGALIIGNNITFTLSNISNAYIAISTFNTVTLTAFSNDITIANVTANASKCIAISHAYGNDMLIQNTTINNTLDQCIGSDTSYAIYEEGVDGVIQDNAIINSGNISMFLYYDLVGTNLGAENTRVINNNISNGNNSGVYIFAGKNITVENNTINTVNNALDLADAGILLLFANDTTQIYNNTVIAADGIGIYDTIGTATNISSNTVQNTNNIGDAFGILVITSVNTTIEDNTVYDTSGTSNVTFGIAITDTNPATIENNILYGNDEGSSSLCGGIFVQAANATITNNTIYNDLNTSCTNPIGIHYIYDDPDQVTLSSNTINCSANNESYGIFAQGYDGNDVTTLLSSGTTIRNADFALAADDGNLTFTNLTISNSGVYDVMSGRIGSNNSNITVINIGVNTTKLNVTGTGSITVQYYARAYVTSGGANISGASVVMKNTNSVTAWTKTTAATGYTSYGAVTAYLQDATTGTSYNNFEATADKSGYDTSTGISELNYSVDTISVTLTARAGASGGSSTEDATCEEEGYTCCDECAGNDTLSYYCSGEKVCCEACLTLLDEEEKNDSVTRDEDFTDFTLTASNWLIYVILAVILVAGAVALVIFWPRLKRIF